MRKDGFSAPRELHKPFLPLDLAILCADSAVPRVDNEGISRVWVDLPEVRYDENDRRSLKGNRPRYAEASFREAKNIPTIGVIPTYRAGWEFLDTADYLEISEHLSKLQKHLVGRSTTQFTESGLQIFSDMFDFKEVVA